jgi:hypothetical protein
MATEYTDTPSSNSIENRAYKRGEVQRSMNGELELGMVDGSYKMVVKDRGGVVEPTTHEARQNLHDVWHGIHEAPAMHTPDGAHTHSPYYCPTPKADPEGF